MINRRQLLKTSLALAALPPGVGVDEPTTLARRCLADLRVDETIADIVLRDNDLAGISKSGRTKCGFWVEVVLVSNDRERLRLLTQTFRHFLSADAGKCFILASTGKLSTPTVDRLVRDTDPAIYVDSAVASNSQNIWTTPVIAVADCAGLGDRSAVRLGRSFADVVARLHEVQLKEKTVLIDQRWVGISAVQ